MSETEKTCLLFTKNFPYSTHETYLFNEISYLKQAFERVVIIPIDEFDYEPSKCRITLSPGLEVLELNRMNGPRGVFRSVHRELATWATYFMEWKLSRDRASHIFHKKRTVSITRHLYRNAFALNSWLKKEGLGRDNSVCYHYWFYHSLILTWMAERYANGPNILQVSRAHSGDLYHSDLNAIEQGSIVFIPFEQLKWKQADRVFVISDFGYRFVQRVFPQYLPKVEVSRLGVLDNGWQPREPVSTHKIIVTCSILSANKRIHFLPRILANVKHVVHWYHFGQGSESDMRQIEQDMKQLCPQSKVMMLGMTPNNKIIDFYKNNSVDLICNLSLTEGIPVALMEAASFGVPMLATAVSGNPEIVNEKNGILIPERFEPEKVAALINRVFDDPEVWKRMSAESRKTFEDVYHAGKNYIHFAGKLKEILAEQQ